MSYKVIEYIEITQNTEILKITTPGKNRDSCDKFHVWFKEVKEVKEVTVGPWGQGRRVGDLMESTGRFDGSSDDF